MKKWIFFDFVVKADLNVFYYGNLPNHNSQYDVSYMKGCKNKLLNEKLLFKKKLKVAQAHQVLVWPRW